MPERYWRAAAAFEIKIAKRKQPKGEPAKGKQSKNKGPLGDQLAASEELE